MEYRLSTINVQVQPGQFGATPLQVVEYAEHLFVNGDEHRNIQPRAFEEVYAVFDRDDHSSYYDALGKANSLNGKLHTDLNQLVHFENVLAPLHRTEVYQRLNQFLSGYDKGQAGHFAQTLLKSLAFSTYIAMYSAEFILSIWCGEIEMAVYV